MYTVTVPLNKESFSKVVDHDAGRLSDQIPVFVEPREKRLRNLSLTSWTEEDLFI